MSERVTVVIPSKNRFHELEAAVASVASQTVPTALYLVDDSTESGLENILVPYRQKIPIEILKNHQGGGISGARNFGLQKANTEFVAFLDSDDVWSPHFLETSLRVLKGNSNCIATLSLSSVFFTGRFPLLAAMKIRILSWIKCLVILLQYVLHLGTVAPSCPFVCQVSHMVFRRQALSRFPGEWKVAEDWAMIFELTNKGCIKIIPQVLLKFRFDFRSNSFNLNKNGSKNKKKYYTQLIQEISQSHPLSPFVFLFRIYTRYLIIGE